MSGRLITITVRETTHQYVVDDDDSPARSAHEDANERAADFRARGFLARVVEELL